MKSQWIVVANASLARFFKRDAPDEPLVPLLNLQHPQSRAKGSNLARERPGREAVDGSAGANHFEPRTDPRRKEHQRFAHEVAARLDDALASSQFNSLCLFASAPFLGELKAELSDAVLHRMQLSIDSDFTSLGLQELERRVSQICATASAADSP